MTKLACFTLEKAVCFTRLSAIAHPQQQSLFGRIRGVTHARRFVDLLHLTAHTHTHRDKILGGIGPLSPTPIWGR